MAKLTDKQRKKIIADYINGISMPALATQHKVSTTTIYRIIHSDKDQKKKAKQKKEENSQEVLKYMAEKAPEACRLIDNYLTDMLDENKIAKASIVQLATALGIVADKFAFALTEKTGQAAQMGVEDDPITKALKEEFAKDGTIRQAKTDS